MTFTLKIHNILISQSNFNNITITRMKMATEWMWFGCLATVDLIKEDRFCTRVARTILCSCAVRHVSILYTKSELLMGGAGKVTQPQGYK